MFCDSKDEDVLNAVLRRKYVYETVSENGMPLISRISYPVSTPKSAHELAELHHEYNTCRSKVITLERAVDLVEELGSLDRTKLDGGLGTASLEGTALSLLYAGFVFLSGFYCVCRPNDANGSLLQRLALELQSLSSRVDS